MDTTNSISAILPEFFTSKESEKKIRVRETVKKVFNNLPDCTVFYGWELKQMCLEISPDLSNVYLDTFLRALRLDFHGQYALVSKPKLKYMKLTSDAINKAADKYLNEKRLQEGR